MFLPRLIPEANKFIRDSYSMTRGNNFVRGQLQHYGVDYEEREFTVNGTRLLKKALEMGKCDRVPGHIEELRAQMHTEWLESQSEEQLASYPEWIFEKFFVNGSGQPDPKKTTKVVGFSFPAHYSTLPTQLREAVGKLNGLHHATALGQTQVVYLG